MQFSIGNKLNISQYCSKRKHNDENMKLSKISAQYIKAYYNNSNNQTCIIMYTILDNISHIHKSHMIS